MLNLSGLLGSKSARPHVFVGPCHDFEELWVVRGSLTEVGVRLLVITHILFCVAYVGRVGVISGMSGGILGRFVRIDKQSEHVS
jgi:hypothetical protein